MIGLLAATFGCGALFGAVGAVSGLFAFSVMLYRRAIG